jgi:hypothetical protein
LLALLGSFTPSTANISFPINPASSHTSKTSRKIVVISRSSVAMKCAIVVKCGWLSAEIAMNSTFSRHNRSICRLEVIPRE